MRAAALAGRHSRAARPGSHARGHGLAADCRALSEPGRDTADAGGATQPSRRGGHERWSGERSGDGGSTGGGIGRILALAEALAGYYLFHAARADLLRRLGRDGAAIGFGCRALSLTENAVERRYLGRRLAEVAPA